MSTTIDEKGDIVLGLFFESFFQVVQGEFSALFTREWWCVDVYGDSHEWLVDLEAWDDILWVIFIY